LIVCKRQQGQGQLGAKLTELVKTQFTDLVVASWIVNQFNQNPGRADYQQLMNALVSELERGQLIDFPVETYQLILTSATLVPLAEHIWKRLADYSYLQTDNCRRALQNLHADPRADNEILGRVQVTANQRYQWFDLDKFYTYLRPVAQQLSPVLGKRIEARPGQDNHAFFSKQKELATNKFAGIDIVGSGDEHLPKNCFEQAARLFAYQFANGKVSNLQLRKSPFRHAFSHLRPYLFRRLREANLGRQLGYYEWYGLFHEVLSWSCTQADQARLSPLTIDINLFYRRLDLILRYKQQQSKRWVRNWHRYDASEKA
jgi:hypothetical protein